MVWMSPIWMNVWSQEVKLFERIKRYGLVGGSGSRGVGFEVSEALARPSVCLFLPAVRRSGCQALSYHSSIRPVCFPPWWPCILLPAGTISPKLNTFYYESSLGRGVSSYQWNTKTTSFSILSFTSCNDTSLCSVWMGGQHLTDHDGSSFAKSPILLEGRVAFQHNRGILFQI